jgi:hypothetical protein
LAVQLSPQWLAWQRQRESHRNWCFRGSLLIHRLTAFASLVVRDESALARAMTFKSLISA